MKKIDARITILGGGRNETNEVTIEVVDELSGCTFLKIEMTPDQFVEAAMGRLGRQKCDCSIDRLHLVGKKLEIDKIRIEMPECGYDEREKIAMGIAEKECPEGWISDGYFRSQGSFYRSGNKNMAQCTIRRWVDVPAEVS